MRGNAAQTQVHFKGKNDDFIVIVDDAESVRKWRSDKTIPLAQIVSGWKVFVTHGHGNQGILDSASKSTLEAEFGTSKDDDVVQQILEKGTIISHENSGRDGETNISKGGSVAH